MFYVAKLVEKTRIFQTAFRICENNIYITNTNRAKKKFLKSGIRNVIFSEEFLADDLLKAKLCPMYDCDEKLIYPFVKGWIEDVVKLLGMHLPLDEIAVIGCDEAVVSDCALFSKIVTVKGEGKDRVEDGVLIRYVKTIKKPPSLAVTTREGLSLSLCVPTISLGSFNEGTKTAHWSNLSFKTDVLPFEIGAASLIFLIKKGVKISFVLTDYRKKLPMLFTFC